MTVSGPDGAEAQRQPGQVVEAEGLVQAHAVHADVDHLVEAGGAGQVEGHGLFDGLDDELLLAGDAAEVTGGIGVPTPVLHVLQRTTPGQGQGLLAVQVHAALAVDDEAGVLVPHGGVEPHGDTADGLDQALEPAEVDLDVVVDGNAQRLLDGVDQGLTAVGVGRVDAVLRARAGDGQPEVTGDRQELDPLGVGLDPGHEDGVGALPARLGAVEEGAGVGGIVVEVLAGVGADEQEVLGLTRGRRGQRDVAVAGDLLEAVTGVADQGGRGQAAHGGEQADADERALAPRPVLPGAARVGLLRG